MTDYGKRNKELILLQGPNCHKSSALTLLNRFNINFNCTMFVSILGLTR